MKRLLQYIIIFILFCGGINNLVYASNEIPADNPYIQYYGRWDFSDPLAPTHSWPGVYIYAEFEGTSIGIKTNDNACWYNIFIDSNFVKVFQGNKAGVNSYTLASGLANGQHSILITLRGETSWTKFSFNGFILDDGKNLLPPPPEPERKIEFLGDSYTSASGNEWTGSDAAPSASYDNIYEGFASITARHFGAQYHVTSRGGIGLVTDWQGNYPNNLPDYFDRTLFYTSLPKWDFEQWIPNLAVICLGLNDYAGFGGWNGSVSQTNTDLFKSRYHSFIAQIRDVYPGVKILAVAANNSNWIEWIYDNVQQVVEEENSQGHNDVFFTYFPNFDASGYVNNGHPNVETHHKIADCLIAAIDSINAWEPYNDVTPPRIVKLPASPFTVYDTSYILNVQTDSYATVKYSTEDKSYDQMEFTFETTGKRNHITTISCEHNRQYTFYLRAMDVNGNKMDTSAVIHFNVDTTKVFLTWTAQAYDDTKWNSGAAPLGNDNSAGLKTATAPAITTYFRRKINIDSVQNIGGLGLLVKGHDGVVVYLNGEKIGMMNMLQGSDITYSSLALSPVTFNQMFIINSANSLDKLHNGENEIAVEMHASVSTDPAISFDAQLINDKNQKIFPLGSEWYFYDNGDTPSFQIADKTTGISEKVNNLLPGKAILYSNYPNPFNPTTNIKFRISDLPASKAGFGFVTLKVYDVLGNKVATLINEERKAGTYEVEFYGSNLSSGIYFYQLKAGSYFETKKMILLK
jgi:hypothetical protein